MASPLATADARGVFRARTRPRDDAHAAVDGRRGDDEEERIHCTTQQVEIFVGPGAEIFSNSD